MPFFSKLVILFTRYPWPGQCKKRLIPSLGEEQAAQVHRQMVNHSLSQVLDFLAHKHNTALYIYYHGSDQKQMQEWLGATLSFYHQEGANLGERMVNALHDGQQGGHDTVLIGSDCPDIDSTILDTALTALRNSDLVIGPSHDGGYYLIGVSKNLDRQSWAELFRDISWGSNTVFQETLNKVQKQKLRPHILPTLHDIDTPEDLKYFRHRPHPQ